MTFIEKIPWSSRGIGFRVPKEKLTSSCAAETLLCGLLLLYATGTAVGTPILVVPNGRLGGYHYVSQLENGTRLACTYPWREDILARVFLDTPRNALHWKGHDWEQMMQDRLDQYGWRNSSESAYGFHQDPVAQACEPLHADVASRWRELDFPVVALVEHGYCTYATKIAHARAAGAVAVLLIDSQQEFHQPESGRSTVYLLPRPFHGSAVALPLLLINYLKGSALRNGINRGPPLLVYFHNPSQTQDFDSELPLVLVKPTRSSLYACSEPISTWAKVPATMVVVEGGGLARFANWTANGQPGATQYHTGIEVRGYSSSILPKQQYGVETRDASDLDLHLRILDFPKQSDWVLAAPYLDKTFMRNTLLFYLYRQTGRYASRFEYVELFISDDSLDPVSYPRHYRGLYYIAEKIKRDDSRVRVRRNQYTPSGDITGGYIVKVDHVDPSQDREPLFTTNLTEILFAVTYPTANKILPEHVQYISKWMDDMEAALYGMNWLHPTRGYRRFLDVPSFVDYLLIAVELSNNADSLLASVFMSKEADELGGKLSIGPPWDFNFAFGNCIHKTAHVPRGWRYLYIATRVRWFSRMMQDPEFVAQTQQRWAELRQDLLSDARIQAFICTTASKLNSAAHRDFWNWHSRSGWNWGCEYLKDPPLYASYQEEVDALLYFVMQRVHWMDDNIHDIANFDQVGPCRNRCHVEYAPGSARTYTQTEVEQCLQTCTWVASHLAPVYEEELDFRAARKWRVPPSPSPSHPPSPPPHPHSPPPPWRWNRTGTSPPGPPYSAANHPSPPPIPPYPPSPPPHVGFRPIQEWTTCVGYVAPPPPLPPPPVPNKPPAPQAPAPPPATFPPHVPSQPVPPEPQLQSIYSPGPPTTARAPSPESPPISFPPRAPLPPPQRHLPPPNAQDSTLAVNGARRWTDNFANVALMGVVAGSVCFTLATAAFGACARLSLRRRDRECKKKFIALDSQPRTDLQLPEYCDSPILKTSGSDTKVCPLRQSSQEDPLALLLPQTKGTSSDAMNSPSTFSDHPQAARPRWEGHAQPPSIPDACPRAAAIVPVPVKQNLCPPEEEPATPSSASAPPCADSDTTTKKVSLPQRRPSVSGGGGKVFGGAHHPASPGLVVPSPSKTSCSPCATPVNISSMEDQESALERETEQVMLPEVVQPKLMNRSRKLSATPALTIQQDELDSSLLPSNSRC